MVCCLFIFLQEDVRLNGGVVHDDAVHTRRGTSKCSCFRVFLLLLFRTLGAWIVFW